MVGRARNGLEPAQRQAANQRCQRLAVEDVPAHTVAADRGRVNDRVRCARTLHVADDGEMRFQLARLITAYAAVNRGPVGMFRVLVIHSDAGQVAEILQHVAAQHQQAGALASRQLRDPQRTLHVHGTGMFQGKPPGEVRREVEHHCGSRHALAVGFAEPKAFCADIAGNCLYAFRLAPQAAYLFTEPGEVFRVAHQHPHGVPGGGEARQ